MSCQELTLQAFPQSRRGYGVVPEHPLQRDGLKMGEIEACLSAGRKNQVGREGLKTQAGTEN